VIVVESDVPEYAYFGFLNANLAVRCGAAGAIIGGHTRDASDVESLEFPVFSSGYSCRDVKDRGAVESINRTIKLQGVRVEYESLVYADQDGVVVIPRDIESKVLQRCREVVEQEMHVLADIRLDRNVDDILDRNGSF
jgi:regulator of RNase E activity RraA